MKLTIADIAARTRQSYVLDGILDVLAGKNVGHKQPPSARWRHGTSSAREWQTERNDFVAAAREKGSLPMQVGQVQFIMAPTFHPEHRDLPAGGWCFQGRLVSRVDRPLPVRSICFIRPGAGHQPQQDSNGKQTATPTKR